MQRRRAGIFVKWMLIEAISCMTMIKNWILNL